MYGIVLNEKHPTYPVDVFMCIEKEVKALNWLISNVECYGNDNYHFPFEDSDKVLISGQELFDLLQDHARIQFVWGLFQGFTSSVDPFEIMSKPEIDIQSLDLFTAKTIRHIDPDSVLEIVAFDSSETYILTDSFAVINKLACKYKKANILDGRN